MVVCTGSQTAETVAAGTVDLAEGTVKIEVTVRAESPENRLTAATLAMVNDAAAAGLIAAQAATRHGK